MIDCILPIGIPGSGKSTWAREWVAEDKFNRARINNDDIRMMLNGGDYAKGYETMVGNMREALVKAAFAANKSVVIDNLNISPRHFKDAVKWAKASGKEVCVFEKHFYIEVDVAVERDAKREGKSCVGRKVIEHWFRQSGKEQFKHYHTRKEVITKQQANDPPTWNKSLSTSIISDLDGTLSLLNGRNPYDASTSDQDLPNKPVIEVVRAFHENGYGIIFCSGREDKDREPTERFLAKHMPEVKYSLYMRKTGDQRKDAVVKEEIYHENIEGETNIEFVMDDRRQVVELWRDVLGLPTFQVAWGDF